MEAQSDIDFVPKSTAEIIGQEEAIKKLKQAIASFNETKKAALLYGPPGCGKTSSIYAVGTEGNFEILEVNASDARNKGSIEEILGPASKQMSLFMQEKLILIDEVDGVSGSKDRGGVAAMVSVIKESKFPVVMTANNPFDKKLSSLRKQCVMIQYNELSTENVEKAINLVCTRKGIITDPLAVKGLALRCGGDLRGVLTDLKILTTQTNHLTKESLAELSQREKTEPIQKALLKILKTSSADVAKGAFDLVNENIDECFMWLDENIPKEYKNAQDLSRAYEIMSIADVFKGRIPKRQHWRFLAYINELLTAGVATAKTQKYTGHAKYERSSRILKIWIANQKIAKKKSVLGKIAEKTHCSTKRADYMLTLLKQYPKSELLKLKDNLDLDDIELSYLTAK